MPDFWISLLAFVLCVVLLYWLQRWITQHVQGIGLLLFNSSNAGMALLWFVLFPGIILHEASHWIMAKLLGVKTGRFRVWPQPKGKEIVLGSVEVQRGGVLRDSLVGLAPFLAGTLALLAIGTLSSTPEPRPGVGARRLGPVFRAVAGHLSGRRTRSCGSI